MPVDRTYICIDQQALDVAWRQARDEGRVLDSVGAEFDRVRDALETDTLDYQEDARALLQRVRGLPERDDYEYTEPSSLAEIRRERPAGPRRVDVPPDVSDRIRAAWLGRCCGCLLGKPVERWSSERLQGFLRATGNDPLREYVTADMPDDVWEAYGWDEAPSYRRAFADELDHMVRDDDIDYTVVALGVLSRHGLAFDSGNVGRFWLHNLPAGKTYTAERVAYRNMLTLRDPPETARHCNPYREGIGAQIRADLYGYVCAGDPERAAELAWRDARVSHVKNGVYGAMWIAAMLAAAPATTDPATLIRTGLSEIPANSRFTAAIEDVLAWYGEGLSYDRAVAQVHDRWDECQQYDWLHAISNAQIVAIGLCWGEGEFATAVGRAVQAAFDTDCNGATVGSLFGMLHGTESIPREWTAPLGDSVETAVAGFSRPSISGLARDTVEIRREAF